MAKYKVGETLLIEGFGGTDCNKCGIVHMPFGYPASKKILVTDIAINGNII